MTDHDSCAGYPATVGICRRVLRGLELTCRYDGRTVHVLLYDAVCDDERWEAVEAQLRTLREERKNRLYAIAERLARLGIHIDVQAIIAEAGGRSVGRPDIARALVAAGVVGTLDEAFQRFIRDGAVADVPLAHFSVAEGLTLGQRAGAKMALAHPHTLGQQSVELLRRYRHCGLEGLECYYGLYTQRQRRRWLSVARKLDLVVTGGSDFHGSSLPQIRDLGVALPRFHADRLCKWLEL
ncbi:MAG: hypothetical protein MJE77_24800 [Proteobacteria bacterium]|nr:hypothetical protein [Pseudomonadota bacterium]